MTFEQFRSWGDHTASSDGGPSMGITATALIGVTALALMHPHPLVLPLLSILLVTGGMIAAAIQTMRYRNTAASLIDKLKVPGLILFFGFAAAMLGDPDPAVQSLQKLR